MPITRRHTIYAVQRYDAASPISFGGVKGQAIEYQNEVRNDTTSGEIYPTHLALVNQMPRATWSTVDLATALTTIGLTGLALTTANPLNLFAYKMAEGGGRASGSVHRKYTVNEGIVVPTRITCNHGEDARIEYLVLPTYDGTNVPVVITDSSALATQGTDIARFTIGGATVGGVAINHIVSWELDFGIIAEQEGADSDIYPTHVSIQEAMPVFRFRGRDIEWIKSNVVPDTGLNATHANTLFYLRKRSQGAASGFVANGTSEHISLTGNGLAIPQTLFEGSADRNPPAEVSLELPLKYDGTNAPVVIDTTAAIA